MRSLVTSDQNDLDLSPLANPTGELIDVVQQGIVSFRLMNSQYGIRTATKTESLSFKRSLIGLKRAPFYLSQKG